MIQPHIYLLISWLIGTFFITLRLQTNKLWELSNQPNWMRQRSGNSVKMLSYIKEIAITVFLSRTHVIYTKSY